MSSVGASATKRQGTAKASVNVAGWNAVGGISTTAACIAQYGQCSKKCDASDCAGPLSLPVDSTRTHFGPRAPQTCTWPCAPVDYVACAIVGPSAAIKMAKLAIQRESLRKIARRRMWKV